MNSQSIQYERVVTKGMIKFDFFKLRDLASMKHFVPMEHTIIGVSLSSFMEIPFMHRFKILVIIFIVIKTLILQMDLKF